MHLLIIGALLAFSAIATTTNAEQTSAPGGNLCNYPATGDESVQSAVPIADFRTSGLDFVRPAWCITHCQDRTSLKASVLFQPANSTSPTFNVRTSFKGFQKTEVHAELVSGTPIRQRDDPPDDFNFCIDDNISQIVDQVVSQYNDIETMSEALNYYINKPGWAFLLYDMGKPPTVTVTLNVKQDPNYCMKMVTKQLGPDQFMFLNLFSGLVQTQQ